MERLLDYVVTMFQLSDEEQDELYKLISSNAKKSNNSSKKVKHAFEEFLFERKLLHFEW